MTNITCDEAISDLKTIFGVDDKDGKFLIERQLFDTSEVENKLKEYFSDRKLSDGFCIISEISKLYTKFEIVKKGVV